jgi:cytochrome c
MRPTIAVAFGLVLSLAGCEGRDSPSGATPSTPATPASASVPVAEVPVPEGPFNLGRKPTSTEIAAWSINVNPTGTNLPEGRGNSSQGQKVFAAKCAVCHGQNAEGTPPLYPKLVGKDPTDFGFDADFKIAHTIGNYWPYATTLYDYIRRTMPLTAPGSLSPDETYAVVAYLLAENGVIADDVMIDARSLPKVKMPAHDHFVPDNRTGGTTFK